MRIPHPLLLAFAGSLTLVRSKYVPFIDHDALNIAATDQPENPGLVEKYALPGEQCNTWVGIEKIFMVEITKVGPDESTATSTLTSCIATLTRSICATTAPNHPCYPCVMGTPTSSDLATVTVASTPPPYHTHPQLPQSRPLTQGVRDPQTSCSTSPPEETLTLTIQLCSTCDATIYIGTVPGYTPGGPCHGCTPYSSSPAAVPCTDSSSGEGIVAETTTTTTSTATSTVCDESDTEGDAGTTSAPPGNPGLPTTTSCSDGTGVTVSSTGTVTATAAPPVVTAGGGKNGVGGVVGALVMGVVVVVVGM